MNRNGTSPSYLVRAPFGYCFRMVVPKNIQSLVGKTELRYSLRTGSLQAAKQKARLLAGHIQLYFQRLRQQGVIMGRLTVTQLESLVTDYIKHCVQAWNHPQTSAEDYDFEQNEPPPYQTARELQEYIATLEAVREDLVVEMNLGQCQMLEESVLKLLKRNGIDDIRPGSQEFQRLCYLIIKAEIQLLPLQQRHMQGDFSYTEELAKLFPSAFPRGVLPVPEAPEMGSVSLGEVAARYWKEREAGWKPRTRMDYRKCDEQLLSHFGKDTLIQIIDYPQARSYKDFLLAKTGRKGRGLSGSRIDIYLGYAKGLFTFARRNHFVERNPFEGLQLSEKGRRVDEQRDVFDVDDLKKLFLTSREYGQDRHLHPYNFWIPLLGLFTGCRLEELCQLYVADIKKSEDIWVLDINADKPDKSVKTNERRLVPLHPLLVKELGFVEFIKNLPDPEGRVFPELKRINNRYGHSFSQWFGRFRQRCEVVPGKGKKTFHSFRHTVSNHLKQKGVDETYIAELLGHSRGSITMERYGKRYEPKNLLERAVMKIDYGIDFSHLKNSKFVVK